ncbi:MAG: hypothetical protein GWP03_05540 [Proteobacteria bacterium]|nr:hypothetical protein [Pseudomonadota bacterium]
MNNLYIIIALLLIITIGTILFRKRAFRFIPIEIVMLGAGFILGPYALNLLNRVENIQIEPVITLLIGATALFAGLKFRIRDFGILKKIFILTFFIYSVSFFISLSLFSLINRFVLHSISLPSLILISAISASVFPSYYSFSRKKTPHSDLFAVISNFTLFIIFFSLLFLTPFFESGSPLRVNYIYSILLSPLDIIIFSSIMFFLFKNSHDENEFLIIFFGISIFNVVICYIFNINSASTMFFIGFILTNTLKNEYFRFKNIIESLEHPFFIGLLLLIGSYIVINGKLILAIPYFLIHLISITSTMFLFRHYTGKLKFDFVPQTGILYTILLSLLILNNDFIIGMASSIILANLLFYIIYYFTEAYAK